MNMTGQGREDVVAGPSQPVEGENQVFVEYEEKRTVAPGPSGRTTKSKHVHFIFKDKEGNKVLGAQGFDHGDAHYVYRTAPNFTHKYGTIECHNRKELVAWLEMVIKESRMQAEGTVDLEVARLGEPTEDNPEGLYYVDTRHEKNVLSDGRKLNKWYLIDQHRNEHLAVRGEERETRDGHYNYTALDPFKTKQPLMCSNQTGVMHWLEHFLTHHAPDSALHVGDHIKDVNPRSPKSARSPGTSPKRVSNDGQRMLEPTRTSKRARVPSYKGAEALQSSIDGAQASSGPATPTATTSRTSDGRPMAFPQIPDATLPTPVPFQLNTDAINKPPPALILTQPKDATPAPLLPDPAAQTPLIPTPGQTPDTVATKLPPASAVPPSAVTTTPRTKLGGAAEQSHMKRLKVLRAAAESQANALRAAVLSELRQQTSAMKATQDASKEAALRWALDEPPQADCDHVAVYASVLKAALEDAGIPVPSATSTLMPAKWGSARARNGDGRTHELGPPHIRILEVLEALREVGTSYVNCQLLVSLNVIPLVQAVRKYPEASVAAMAANVLKSWRQAATQHVLVLTDPIMAVDPVEVLERGLADKTLDIPLPETLRTSLNMSIQRSSSSQLPTPAALPSTSEQFPSMTPLISDGGREPSQAGVLTTHGAQMPDSIFKGTAFKGPSAAETPGLASPVTAAADGLLSASGFNEPPRQLDLTANKLLPQDSEGPMIGSPAGSHAKRARGENDDDSVGVLISRSRRGDMFSVGFGSALSLPGIGNGSISFGSKHLPEAVDEDDEDVGSWGTAEDEQEALAAFRQPPSTSVSDLVQFLEWCTAFLTTAKHRTVARHCTTIKAHVDACLKDNAAYFSPDVVPDLQLHAKELEKQGSEIKQGMDARDCHHFVRVCLQHLHEMLNMVNQVVPPV